MIVTPVQQLAWFHRLIRAARDDVAFARTFRSVGMHRLADDYLALAFARRRTAHAFLQGAKS